MGILEFALGRTEGQRKRRAARINAKFADDPRVDSSLLEPLTRANEMPRNEHIEILTSMVRTGVVPRRISLSIEARDGGIAHALALFDDALLIASAKFAFGNEKVKPVGGVFHVSQLEAVDMIAVPHRGWAYGVTVKESNGITKYAFISPDEKEVESFFDESQAVWQAEQQRRETESYTTNVSIDSSLPPEEQIAALDIMRQSGLPDDAYRAAVDDIRRTAAGESGTRAEN